MKMRKEIVMPFLAIFFISCSQNSTNSFSDDQLVKIADYQDRRLSDSLYQFLADKNPIYRRATALAFASIQDTLASKVLGGILLEDGDSETRKNIAFALGQTGGFEAVNALIPAKEDSDPQVVKEVLEALGKSLKQDELQELINYQPIDSLTTIGLARGFYRIGLRNILDSAVTSRVATFLKSSYPEDARLGAAHYFARSNASFSGTEDMVISSALSDRSPYVRMAAVAALRKLDSSKAIDLVKKILNDEQDYRVRSNAVRVISSFELKDVLPILEKAFTDNNINVGITASEVIRSKSELSAKLPEISKSYSNGRIVGNLYAAQLKAEPSTELVNEILARYKTEEHLYSKVHLVSALGECGPDLNLRMAEFLVEEVISKESPYVIKSSAASALMRMNNHPKFQKDAAPAFAKIYKQAILDGDPAVISILCNALSNQKLGYKEIIKEDYSFLIDAKNNLKLPKDFEAIEPLNIAIAYFEGTPKPEPPKNEFNHPINWELAKAIPSNQLVKIQTSKGEIVIRLLIDESPGSVTNFVDLLNQGYYENKIVHRVVPNFVIQTGCYRGDGFGSEDYSLRSEFSLTRYSEGMVGMASAGKDTEGTQWFITHSPTPHLDGRYSIFAIVESGMEVVQDIEVGDRIIHTELIKK